MKTASLGEKFEYCSFLMLFYFLNEICFRRDIVTQITCKPGLKRSALAQKASADE